MREETKRPLLERAEEEGGGNWSSGAPERLLLLVSLVCTAGVVLVHWPEALPAPAPACRDTCRVELVESTPEGLTFNSSLGHTPTYAAWSRLMQLARQEVRLAGMYWTLRGEDIYEDPSAAEGESVYQQLHGLRARGVKLRIAQNLPPPGQPNRDTEDLARETGAEVRSLDFGKLMGSGVLHTKLWLVDNKHFYVGSANFDWRSLTQVKEVGVLVRDCACLAEDMAKVWEVYWALGGQENVPERWPARLETRYNAETPLEVAGPASVESVYLSSSPPPFCPPGRTTDIQSVLHTINSARQFVHIAVMDYFPTTIYSPRTKFWPVIDDALRAAAVERGVRVRLLVSHWAHTRPAMARYTASLAALTGTHPAVDIQVAQFTVPPNPRNVSIPFSRVNHNKYMVTDTAGYIGTSNWSGDYFISTGGIGFVFTGRLRAELAAVFARDWSSAYTGPVTAGSGAGQPLYSQQL